MKISMKQNGYTNELHCPDGKLLVGLDLTVSGSNLVKIDPAFFGISFTDTKPDVIETTMPGGSKLVLHCHVSDDPDLAEIFKDYLGMKMAEICYHGLEITITV